MLDEELKDELNVMMEGLSPEDMDEVVEEVVSIFSDIYGHLRAVDVSSVTVEGVWVEEEEVYSKAELIDLNLCEQEDELGIRYDEEDVSWRDEKWLDELSCEPVPPARVYPPQDEDEGRFSCASIIDIHLTIQEIELGLDYGKHT